MQLNTRLETIVANMIEQHEDYVREGKENRYSEYDEGFIDACKEIQKFI